MRRFCIIVATALLCGASLPARAASTPKASYEQALAKERAVQDRARVQKPTVAELRALSASFENVTRRHPTSGYADNALFKAAEIAAQVHERTGQDADRERAQRLYTWLATEYPASSLVAQARTAARALDAADRPAPTTAAAAPKKPAPKPFPEPSSRAQAEAETTSGPAARPSRLAAAPTTTLAANAAAPPPVAPATLAAPPSPLPSPAPAATAKVREIRRAVLPELVRVTIELDGEVAYRQEKVDRPSRLFFDLKAATTPALQDAVLTWPDDVVRQVRLGRQPQNTTRVVLDLDGVSRYSVFTLYNPFRVVIDLERTGGARAGLQPTTPPATVTSEKYAKSAAAALPAPRLPVSPDVAALVPEAPPILGTDMPSDTERQVEQLKLPAEFAIQSREIEPAPAPVAATAAAPVAQVSSTSSGATTSPASAAKGAAGKSTSRTAKRVAAQPAEDLAPAGNSTSGTPVPTSGKASAPAPAAAAAPAAIVAAASGAPTKPDAAPSTEAAALAPPPAPAPKAPATNSNGSFSLARQLGLGISRVVIDPGHGGHDPGALGKNVAEAELVLDVALRLEKLLLKQPGVEVVLTRRDDTFVPLEERTAIANREQADLFLSIHANASRNPNARGVEAYFLNFASTPDAEIVAARENSASGRAMHSLPDIVRAIALNNKLDESRDFAGMVQDALVKRLAAQNKLVKNLGVKQAPFVVLIGASMPSVLAEISFVTNPQEAQLLRGSAYRQRIAEALFDAVVKYQKALKTSVGTIALQ